MASASMTGKHVVVTGATRGIGLETALALARMGASVALVARSRSRGEACLDEVRRASAGGTPSLFVADLASLSQVRRLAAELDAGLPRLDVLVNNAGAIHATRKVTEDGHELTLAVNHLAPFLLTNLLLAKLRASAPARVVTVSSEAHRRARLDLDDLELQRGYRALGAYGRSKLANVLFSNELARRVPPAEVTSNSLHPGVVATGFGRNDPGWFRLAVRLVSPLLLSAERGARTSVHVASAPELATVTGRYFQHARPARPSAAALDEASQLRLWEVSAALVGLRP